MAYSPIRKIEKVQRQFTDHANGTRTEGATKITLAPCNHIADCNQFYTFTVGDTMKCFECGKILRQAEAIKDENFALLAALEGRGKF